MRRGTESTSCGLCQPCQPQELVRAAADSARLAFRPQPTSRALKSGVGMRLLTRTTRSVAPTEAGSRLIARVAPALASCRLPSVEVSTMRRHAAACCGSMGRASPLSMCWRRYWARSTTAPDIVFDVVTQDAITDVVAAGSTRHPLGEKSKEHGGHPDRRHAGDGAGAVPAYFARHGVPQQRRVICRSNRCIRHSPAHQRPPVPVGVR